MPVVKMSNKTAQEIFGRGFINYTFATPQDRENAIRWFEERRAAAKPVVEVAASKVRRSVAKATTKTARKARGRTV